MFSSPCLPMAPAMQSVDTCDVRNKAIAWALLGVGAVAVVAANVGITRDSVPPGPIPAWLPVTIGAGGLAIGWGITLLLSGTARRMLMWIMGFSTAWVLVVWSLLTMVLMRVRR
jgi:hypothetical protein